MKIWIVVTDGDGGVSSKHYLSEKEASDAALAFLFVDWPVYFEDTPMPDNWADAMSELSTQLGYMDSVHVNEFDLTMPPPPPRTPAEQAYYEFAKNNEAEEGRIEFDDHAAVARGDDEGAYVAAWIWVSSIDAGICTVCGDPNADDGEGHDGMCGSCADKAEAKRESARKVATVLAALRLFQRLGSEFTTEENDIASDGNTIAPLSNDEIDDLCAEINGATS